MAGKGAGKKPLMVRGSVYTMRRKCGKDYCRCMKGELHETPVLSYSEKGRTRIVALSPEDVPKVRKAIERYQKAKREIEDEAMRGIERLRGEIKARKGGGR